MTFSFIQTFLLKVTIGLGECICVYMYSKNRCVVVFSLQTVGSAASHTVVDPLGPSLHHGLASIT